MLILILWAVAILFWNNGAIALWDQDEAAYAGFALRMVEHHDWLIPDFTWGDVHRKPPLQFWAIALCYQLFGVSEFTTRLPGSFAVLAIGFTIVVLGKGLWPLKTRLIATLICWSSLFLPLLGKIALTDGLLVWLETVAMLSWLQELRQPNWRSRLLLWVAVALGLLTKGPPILALVMGSEVMLGMLQWVSRGGFKTRPYPIIYSWFIRWSLAPLAFLPVGIWAWLTIQQDGGEFIQWFLDFYLFKRVTGETISNQWGLPGYYAGVLAIAFLPWLPWLFNALQQLWQQRRNNLAMWAWLAAGWLGYELIPSKLPSYVLGVYPAIALLIAHQVTQPQNPKVWRWGLWGFGVFALILTIALGGIAVWLRSLPLGITVMIWLLGSIGLVVIWRTHAHDSVNNRQWWAMPTLHLKVPLPSLGEGFRVRARANRASSFHFATAHSLILLTLIWGWVLPSWDLPRSASKRLAETAIAHLESQGQLFLAQDLDLPSLAFYLEQQGQDYILIDTVDYHDACGRMDVIDVATQEQAQRIITPDLPQQRTLSKSITGWFGTFGHTQTYHLLNQEQICSNHL